MMDLNAIRNRIAYYQATVHQLSSALDRSEEPQGSPLKQHLAKGIVEAARGLASAKSDLRDAESINARKESANV
jgi:hypothetical protein